MKTVGYCDKDFDNRIKEQLKYVDFISEVPITDPEYESLIKRFQDYFVLFRNKKKDISTEPLFAVALVQIGVRKYDEGDYWSNVDDILHQKLSQTDRIWLGKGFIRTAKRFGKNTTDNHSQYVENILMQCFVTNKYLNDFFTFLWKYYDLDLERDMDHFTDEEIDSLLNNIQRNDNTSRTQLIRAHTSNAVRYSREKSSKIISIFLHQIDHYNNFEDFDDFDNINRLSERFKQWIEPFFIERNIKRGNRITQRSGEKRFSKPYFSYCQQSEIFYLNIPKQKFDDISARELQLKVFSGEKVIINDKIDCIELSFGCKTENRQISLDIEDIFNTIKVVYCFGNQEIKMFQVDGNSVKVFNTDGEEISLDRNFIGHHWVFIKCNSYTTFSAEESYEKINNNDYRRIYAYFGEKDYIEVENHYYFADKQEESTGLFGSKIINVIGINDSQEIETFSSPPILKLFLTDTEINGGSLIVNQRRNPIRNFIEPEIPNQINGEHQVIIHPIDQHNAIDGMYSVSVDLPGHNRNHNFDFLLLQKFKFSFEEAPYWFANKATLYIEDSSRQNRDAKNFEIIPEFPKLNTQLQTQSGLVNIRIDVPVFSYQFTNSCWEIEKPKDIWWSKFPATVNIRFSGTHQITIKYYEEFTNASYEESFTSRINGVFQCDLTKFRSYINKNGGKQWVCISADGIEELFFNVIVKSEITNPIIDFDEQNQMIHGLFEIVGEEQYFADVRIAGVIIAEKLPLINGSFQIPYTGRTDECEISIYANEVDDWGFGTDELIGNFNKKIINPRNLTGENITILHLLTGDNFSYKKALDWKYTVTELVRMEKENYYKGKLFIENKNCEEITNFFVVVKFPDLSVLNRVFFQFSELDEDCFLYDKNQRAIVINEDKNSSRTVRYRRYDSITEDNFVFLCEYSENYHQPKRQAPFLSFNQSDFRLPSSDFQNNTANTPIIEIHLPEENIPLEKLGFNPITIRFFENHGISTGKQLEEWLEKYKVEYLFSLLERENPLAANSSKAEIEKYTRNMKGRQDNREI